MAARETSQSIDDAAAAWAAREDRGDLSSADREARDAWLHADPRHAGALLRAQAVAMRSEAAQALGEGFDPARFAGAVAAARPSRRGMLAWGGAAAVVATVSVAALSLAPTAHATDRGQIQLVPLPDGSTVMLNTATRITVRYENDRRMVRLVEGEADFTVVGDAARPFVVVVGDRRVEASKEGGFRVRKLARQPVDILVHQGLLRVAEPQRMPVLLASNTQLVLSQAESGGTAPKPQAVSPGLITRELAWREGKIAFEGETLAEAAAAFARYSDLRIVIVDPSLAREPVTGLFAANDPAGFGRAVAALFGAPVTVGRNGVVLGAAQGPA